MIEYILNLDPIQTMGFLTLSIVLSFFATFLIFGQDKELTEEEQKKEQEIARIYFSILSNEEKQKYLAKHPEPFFFKD